MAMQTGEDEKGLRKIMDMTRAISIVILILHCYYFWNLAFVEMGLHSKISDRLLLQIAKTGLFNSFNLSKSIALGLLTISLFGAKGRKEEKINYKTAFCLLCLGIIIFYTSNLAVQFEGNSTSLVIVYLLWTLMGYLLFLVGGSYMSRIIDVKLNDEDIFNKENQTFPQDEKLRFNEYSINLPARYRLKNKWRKSWINIINPFRGILIVGSPGSGKSYFIVEEIIRQHIKKGFTMFVYDFKYDDLTRITYQAFLKYKDNYKVKPRFFSINFDDFSRSNRCNPLDTATMDDISDAIEASRTILLSLNRNWISKQGDFFVESAVNFLAACIWFLAKYENGIYCSLPHVIELMQLDYDKLFTILRTEPEIETLINPFITTYLSDVMETLESQIATPKIALGRLSSPAVYYLLSGNDFCLNINDSKSPKIICMGNNPQKQQVYGAILSLYISRLIKVINKKGGIPCSLIFDEFPTIYFNGIDSLIATARSNKISTTMAVQDYSQLKKDYSKDLAEVVMNITGNIICGQVMGETAKQLSDRFGKIMQDKSTLSINYSDTSISRSKNLELSIPPSVISALSSGEFVGTIADNPEEKISLKAFHCELEKGREYTSDSNSEFRELRYVTSDVVDLNFRRIKNEILKIASAIITDLINDPNQNHSIIKK